MMRPDLRRRLGSSSSVSAGPTRAKGLASHLEKRPPDFTGPTSDEPSAKGRCRMSLTEPPRS